MNREHKDIIACIVQFFLCTGGGFWIGFQAEPQSVGTSGAGALAMAGALFLSWGAAQSLGLMVGSLQFVRQALRRAGGNGADHAARSSRDDRQLQALMGWAARVAMLMLSVGVAVVVWAISAQGDFSDTLLRSLLVGGAATLLMAPALRVVHS